MQNFIKLWIQINPKFVAITTLPYAVYTGYLLVWIVHMCEIHVSHSCTTQKYHIRNQATIFKSEIISCNVQRKRRFWRKRVIAFQSSSKWTNWIKLRNTPQELEINMSFTCCNENKNISIRSGFIVLHKLFFSSLIKNTLDLSNMVT